MGACVDPLPNVTCATFGAASVTTLNVSCRPPSGPFPPLSHSPTHSLQLCLPQTPSGRRQPAHTCCKSHVRAIFSGNNRGAREVHAANYETNVCREARIGTPVPGLELRQGLRRSGCASLVAVRKSATLRCGTDGSECRRAPGQRC